MKILNLIFSLVLGLFILFPHNAEAQSQRNPCVYLSLGGGCIPVGFALAGTSLSPMPVGGIANVSAPTFTEGLPGYLSFDLSGNLRTVSSGGGGGNVNVTQWDTTALGVPTAYGTPPTVGNYIGVNAFITNISIGITPTDRTIVSASGSSQQMAAANASRHSLNIVNNGNANCGINPTGGTAAIGGAGTLTLAPLGAYTPRIPSLSAITIICTSGQPIYGDEN